MKLLWWSTAFLFSLVAWVVLATGHAYPQAVYPIHTAAAVTTSSTSVLAANNARKFLVLVNDSDETIYCSLDTTPAALNEGVRLNSAGGAVFFDIATPPNEIFCIHGGTGSKVLLVTEG